MEKTLGGDRLGAGKRMKVELRNYERSTHDLGYIFRTSMAAGTLVPFMSEVALPGDTFDIKLDCDVKTHPTLGPLFGSYKVQMDVFITPIRLYNAMLHNNTLSVGLTMQNVKLPQVDLLAPPLPTTVEDFDNSQINPSCLLAYLGIRGIGINDFNPAAQERSFNALPILIYWDIYKNYYANKQEDHGQVLHTPAIQAVETVDEIHLQNQFLVPPQDDFTVPEAPASSTSLLRQDSTLGLLFTGTQPLLNEIYFNIPTLGEVLLSDLFANVLVVGGTLTADFLHIAYGDLTVNSWRYKTNQDVQNGKPVVQKFLLSSIDDMKKAILSHWSSVTFKINTPDLEPYKWLYEDSAGILNSLSSQEGLGLKTYQSDLFNNWLRTEDLAQITSQTAIDTSGGSFTIDTLTLSRKVYDMLNRIAVSGGSYDDWIDAVYTHDAYRKCENPMYMGGLIKELVFQEVVSNSASESVNGDQPLGTLAGRGILSKKHKGGDIYIKVDEPSYITGIISLTPRIDYSQGNKWDVHLKTMDDLHKPALDQIGFQDLITEQMAWWDTKFDSGEWIQKSAGKQPAWLNYMTNVNRTYGNFAVESNEMFMTLNRRYEPDTLTAPPAILDLTTYIDPSKYNFIFAETALDAQNFWTQIAVDITARRKMSAKIMPNL